MSSGFGRKGIDTALPPSRAIANTTARRAFTQAPVPDHDDGLSPEARAFIAAERARRSDEPSTGPAATEFASATAYRPAAARPSRSLLLAYVLWWFGSPIGAHRIYLGAYQSAAAMAALFCGGLLMLLVSPLLGIGLLVGWGGWHGVDFFLIPGLHRRYKASQPTTDLARVFA